MSTSPRDPERRRLARGRRVHWLGAPAWLLVAVVLAGVAPPQPALARGEPSIKIGLNRMSVSGVTYTHDTGTEQLTESGPMVGNELFFEWVMSERLGLEIGSTLTPLKRVYTLKGAAVVSDSVTETLNTTSVGLNLYFNKATRRGLKFLLGLGVGSAKVTHEFEGGTLGTQSTTNDLTLNTLKLGLDWITNFAGLRLQYLATSGTTRSSTNLTGVIQTVDAAGSGVVLGIFAFF